jgi:putative membrane protein
MRVADRLTHGWRRIAVATVALATWDVFLDPQMVDAHHWRWTDPSPHLPGVATVPLTNFAGWLLVSLVLMTLMHDRGLHDRGLHDRERERPRDDRPAIVLWVWTWLSSTLANLAFFHRPAVAAWGFVAMGLVGLPLLLRSRRR